MIDAHFHSWLLSRGDYGWLTPALPAIYRDVSIADWQAQAAAHGVKAGVLVQALGVVGWADLLAPDAPARIRALTANPKLKGLRPMLQDIADPDWILQAALAPALQTMSDLGLVLDALIKPLHLPRLLTLAARYPALKLVIDHAAKPDIAAGQWEPWASDLAEVASQTQAVCKISGLLTEAGPKPDPDAARRWAAHVLQVFGEGRVMWGSDWPVLELAGSYSDWWQASRRLSASLSEAGLQALYGGTARRVYRL